MQRMESRTPRDSDSRKRKPHARPDRIIEKRQNWKDYLESEEDADLPEGEEIESDGLSDLDQQQEEEGPA